MTTASARPDLDAHATAVRVTQAELITALRDLLGARLVAYLAGVQETRAVRQWADGTRTIRDVDDEQRLRLAYHVALVLTARDSREVAQSWFQGLNPQLDDRSPARVLRDEKPDLGGPLVLAAARAFAGIG
ncbi:MAG TPA: hypothetical protein VJ831_07780 [Jatrophihabitantaceae bacterium]|nr:hypothetical protein [Jatrophihabitantaceae bacterium]